MGKPMAARATARFKQLSCLELTGEVAIPELLRELHAIIPSHANTFVFGNETGVATNMYLENADSMRIFPLYQQEYHERRDREFKGKSFSDATRSLFGVHEFRTSVVGVEDYDRSDQFNLIERASGNDANYMRLVFRSGRRVLGALTMWRALGAGVWSDQEKRTLGALEPFFVHALTREPTDSGPLVDGDRPGLVIASPDGELIHSSAGGRQLLFYACNPNNTARNPKTVLPPAVMQLCRNLRRIFADDESAPVPSCRVSSAWGTFTFRAEWLDRHGPGAGLIGIAIGREVPLSVRLVRSAYALPVSRRQAEVCFLLASGASNDAIATRLAISRHTANEHTRWIYNKLNVHNRVELVTRLLAAHPSQAEH